jgi:hypothetical protein
LTYTVSKYAEAMQLVEDRYAVLLLLKRRIIKRGKSIYPRLLDNHTAPAICKF